MIFLSLFFHFFIIGLFTIGGGYAMLPLIQQTVVVDHAWITNSTFTDIVAISQMTPGPIGINSATYIGYSVIKQAGYSEFLCISGSFVTTMAVVLPSFLIVLWLCHMYTKFNHSAAFSTIMNWLRPCVAGLIGAAAVLLMTPENFPDWKSLPLLVIAFILSMFLNVNPIYILIGAGVLGYILY